MKSTWDELSTSKTWSEIVAFIRNWMSGISSTDGMSSEELDSILHQKGLRLPAATSEWHRLAANWEQSGLNVWIHPSELQRCGNAVGILTDIEDINLFGVRLADIDIANPPVYSLDDSCSEILFPSFSSFVEAMVINDVIFNDSNEPPIVLNVDAHHAALHCICTTRHGDYFADCNLGSATVVMYVYPSGEAFGRSRTPQGEALLQAMQRSVE